MRSRAEGRRAAWAEAPAVAPAAPAAAPAPAPAAPHHGAAVPLPPGFEHNIRTTDAKPHGWTEYRVRRPAPG
jgi:hypothetical protein